MHCCAYHLYDEARTPFHFWKAVSIVALCREDPLWPGGRHRARETCTRLGPLYRTRKLFSLSFADDVRSRRPVCYVAEFDCSIRLLGGFLVHADGSHVS